ncbi:MAG: T9SS type A sorting domain-containing protein [Bacteroidota bacterium]
MRSLLLACALLAPTLASAQWTFQEDVTIPYGITPSDGAHGVAVDGDGRLWFQNFRASERVIRNGVSVDTRALYVLEQDGSQAPCSPIKYIEDDSGTVIDTLGVYTTDAGALDTRTGRGMTSDADGNIVVSQFDVLYVFDSSSCTSARDSSIVQIARAQPAPGNSLTEAATDGLGNYYVARVVPGGTPVFAYGPGLVPAQNVTDTAYDIGRDLLASSDGLVVVDHAFTQPGAVLHYRPDTFTPFDSLGISLRGLAVESSGVQPGTDWLWFSSGPGGAFFPNEDPEAETNYQAYSWYAFDVEDLLERDGSGNVIGTIENPPMARDSIILSADDWGNAGPGPRGIAFSNDGQTAWVINFAVDPGIGGEIKRFMNMPSTAAEEGAEASGVILRQNQPNPFTGETAIAFELEEPGYTRLRVFDVTGREVVTLLDRALASGAHEAIFDAGELAPGTYVYTLEVEGTVVSRRMSVVR